MIGQMPERVQRACSALLQGAMLADVCRLALLLVHGGVVDGDAHSRDALARGLLPCAHGARRQPERALQLWAEMRSANIPADAGIVRPTAGASLREDDLCRKKQESEARQHLRWR